MLCPVVDYLNHDSKAISDIAYEYFTNEFAVRVKGDFQALSGLGTRLRLAK